MDWAVFLGLLFIALCGVALGFVLGRSYESYKAIEKRYERADLLRHIRESNDRAS